MIPQDFNQRIRYCWKTIARRGQIVVIGFFLPRQQIRIYSEEMKQHERLKLGIDLSSAQQGCYRRTLRPPLRKNRVWEKRKLQVLRKDCRSSRGKYESEKNVVKVEWGIYTRGKNFEYETVK